eukprot:gene15858-27694_t
MAIAFIQALVFAGLQAAPSPVMPLTLLNGTEATRRGAVCLDGSPPGHYFKPAATPAANTSWVVFMKGGAWCTSLDDCVGRSKSNLGSSTKFPSSYGVQGPLDPNPAMNPTFADWNHVILMYCDGASFAGNLTEPLHWSDPKNASNTATIYLRGARVLEYLIDDLIATRGLGRATNVLFTGGSAGGLATYLRADAVNAQLVAPGYIDGMHDAFTLHNCTGGVPPRCIAALPLDEQWNCIFANYSYAYRWSALDLWQLADIDRIGGWDAGCLNRGAQFANCTAPQVKQLQSYAADFEADLTRSLKFNAAGSGGFVTSCLEHQAAIGSAMFNGYTINGVTMQQALTAWWASEGTEPAANHWHLPCTIIDAKPHQCNPTCTSH